MCDLARHLRPGREQRWPNRNKSANGGVVKSDAPEENGKVLKPPCQSKSGSKHDPDEWQVDHISPLETGGSDQVSRDQCFIKWSNCEPHMLMQKV